MGVFSGFEHIVRDHEPLAPFTWLRIGGAAEYFAEPTSIEELQALVRRCREAGVAVRILGNGSNVLVRDEGVSGLVLHLSAATFSQIHVDRRVVRAGGGAKLGHVIATAVREGLGGLEGLVGIPGTVGGALHGHAASQDGDIGQWLRNATLMTRTGEIASQTKEDLSFAYRQSCLDELVLLEAEFELDAQDPRELTKRMQKLWIVKKGNQPLANENSGYVFKSPPGLSAGAIVEQAGMKGARLGDVEVSDRNANFIVAGPKAKSCDAIQLIDSVRGAVVERLGVELEPQLQIW